MKKVCYLVCLLVIVSSKGTVAQDGRVDARGCPVDENGDFDPIPHRTPAHCWGNPGPGFPGNPNPIEIPEVVVTAPPTSRLPRNSTPQVNPWLDWVSAPVNNNQPYQIRLEDFKRHIKNKPFALFGDLDCDIVKKWLATATHQVQQAQLDKLNRLARVSTLRSGITTTTVARLQHINDAYSTVVNLDYFPVTVTQLPVINGKRQTPQEFLSYIRKNINDFVDTDKAIFWPYKLSLRRINDERLWKSNNPLNAVIAIDIDGPDNGSVIVSKFSEAGWTFSTIFDPIYGQHPVSGNRDFGYTQNPNGSYTFFTRGVDRLTSFEGEIIHSLTRDSERNSFPFNQADALWKSFQKGIADYVNIHGGGAQIAKHETQRPNWQVVKDVIEGKKPLSILSNNCKD